MLPKKVCHQCNKRFVPSRVHHEFCSKSCCDGYAKQKTWLAYFRALLTNGKGLRKALSPEMIVELYHKQEGLCAISGVPLTKITGKGQVPTNASIDRIDPGGAYSEDNIRLLCRFVNCFRNNQTDEQFLWWVRRIAKHNGYK